VSKLFRAIVYVFALNFLFLAGGIGYLKQSGRIDSEKLEAIRKMLFDDGSAATEPSTSQPSTAPANGLGNRLDQVLAEHAHQPVAEQMQFLRQGVDNLRAELDRSARELADRESNLENRRVLLDERARALEERIKAFEKRVAEASQVAEDKGFQDTLERYIALPAKDAKELFLKMDDSDVVRYLQAMDARTSARIMKEFKSPAEMDRLGKVLQLMGKPSVAATRE
jgi:hypothetical protein